MRGRKISATAQGLALTEYLFTLVIQVYHRNSHCVGGGEHAAVIAGELEPQAVPEKVVERSQVQRIERTNGNWERFQRTGEYWRG